MNDRVAEVSRWWREQVDELLRDMTQWAKENRKEAKGDHDRSDFLTGGAEAMEYVAVRLKAMRRGRTATQDMLERMGPKGRKCLERLAAVKS